MKKIIYTLSIVLGLGLSANAQIQSMAGPRIGVTLIGQGNSADYLNNNDGKSALTTQYGWQWESRFGSSTEFTGLVEWIVVVGGMEKGKFLPSISSIIGFRNKDGFEMGFGPNLSGSGLGMVVAMGMNLKSGDLNLPVNIAWVPSKKTTSLFGDEYHYGSTISILVGFNLSK